jgi:hypothetical protein
MIVLVIKAHIIYLFIIIIIIFGRWVFMSLRELWITNVLDEG